MPAHLLAVTEESHRKTATTNVGGLNHTRALGGHDQTKDPETDDRCHQSKKRLVQKAHSTGEARWGDQAAQQKKPQHHKLHNV